MALNGDAASSEDPLYHIVYEIINYQRDTSVATRTTDVFGTYTSLPVAKAVARSCVKNWGQKATDFEIYKVNNDPGN